MSTNIKPSNKVSIFSQPSLIAVVFLVILLSIFLLFKFFSDKLPGSSNQQSKKSIETSKVEWVPHTDLENKYSYRCPKDWTFDNSQVDYGGKVKIGKCIKEFAASKYEFLDGIIVTFGFVPESVARSQSTYADPKVGTIQKQESAKSYLKNGFTVWVAMKDDTQSTTLELNARKNVSGGFYEIDATAVGGSMTDLQYKDLLDEIIGSFNEL